MIFVNFKEYKNTIGSKSEELSKWCEEIAQKSGISIVPIVSPLWAKDGSWLGHVDGVETEAHTGYVSINQAKAAGVVGSLLNHSEHALPLQTIAKTVAMARKDSFKIVVCVKSVGQAERILKKMKPDFLAYEPKYLIGSKTSSIAKERLDAFAQIVQLGKTKGVMVLAGAGIKSREDVLSVVRTGGAGVLVSSAVVESLNFKESLLDLVAGFKV